MIEICGESIAFAAELQTDSQYPRYARVWSLRARWRAERARRDLSLLPRLIQDVPNIILTRARQNIGVRQNIG